MKKNKPTFEEYLCDLENAVKALEEGNLTLDESIEMYKKAVSLSFECNKILEKSKQKIEIIQNGNYEDNDITKDILTEN